MEKDIQEAAIAQAHAGAVVTGETPFVEEEQVKDGIEAVDCVFDRWKQEEAQSADAVLRRAFGRAMATRTRPSGPPKSPPSRGGRPEGGVATSPHFGAAPTGESPTPSDP